MGLEFGFSFFAPVFDIYVWPWAIQPSACTKNAKRGVEVSLSLLLPVTYTPFGCCGTATAYDLGRDNMLM